MFHFDLQRFNTGSGSTTNTVDEHYTDTSNIPGYDQSINEQGGFNSLASLISKGLLNSAFNSSGFSVKTNYNNGSSGSSGNSGSGSGEITKERFKIFGGNDGYLKTLARDMDNYGSVAEWRDANLKNIMGATKGTSDAMTEAEANAYLDKAQEYKTGYNPSTSTKSDWDKLA